MIQLIKIFPFALFALCIASCQDAGAGMEQTGSEMMPDMYHSIAYEANVENDYFLNTFEESVIEYRDANQPRAGVKGTVPRGYAGLANANTNERRAELIDVLTGEAEGSIATPMNASVPYYFEDSDTGRIQAQAELVNNPFPITAKGLAQGKELYEIYCGICHGEKGDGNGWLVAEENPAAAYPAAPANFLIAPHVDAQNGHYYHAIMYGKNVMGAYAAYLNYEERWQVIHWIRNLQAKEKKLVYTQDENTLNAAFGAPAGMEPTMMAVTQPSVNPDTDSQLDNPVLRDEMENVQEIIEELNPDETER